MNLRSIFCLHLLWALCLLTTGCATFISPKTYSIPKDFSKREVLRGIFHVHTIYSHDSEIDLKGVQKTAKKTNLDFVVITDHNSLEGKKVYQEQNFPLRPLLIFGTELTTDVGHLILMGISEMPPAGLTPQEVVNWVKAEGGYVFLSHPTSHKNPWRDFDLEGYDGLEVYNFAHDVYLQNKMAVSSKAMLLTPKAFLKSFQQNPEPGLRLWSEEQKTRSSAAVFAADLHVKSKALGLSFPNTKLQFQATTLYVFSGSLNENEITRAIASGKTYMAREAFGAAHSFDFVAYDGDEVYTIGDRVIQLVDPISFEVSVPKEGNIQLLRDGKIVFEQKAKVAHFTAKETGRYHVEVYQGEQLWILSNPIFVE